MIDESDYKYRSNNPYVDDQIAIVLGDKSGKLFSSDTNAAMMLAESEGDDVLFALAYEGELPFPWKATFLKRNDKGEGRHSHFTASGKTAPMAICIAWSKLKGVNISVNPFDEDDRFADWIEALVPAR